MAPTIKFLNQVSLGKILRGVAAAALTLLAAASTEGVAQNGDELYRALVAGHQLSPAQASALAREWSRTANGQYAASIGNHPVSEAQCQSEVLASGRLPRDTRGEAICGRPFMVPVYRAGEAPESARVCIDQFEFPNLPCRYPVTWVRPIDAAALCASMGKRLCDAHEWEGACAGSLEPPDFRNASAVNAGRDITWAYGRQRRGDICAFGVGKSPQCDAAMLGRANPRTSCGANTYPSGYFTQCRSPLGVYDQHGNVAEHMVLPRSPGELRSNGQAGVTEMKGSWFAFSRSANSSVHPDDCRWREPGWHRTPTSAGNGHSNYHLGFRCCADR